MGGLVEDHVVVDVRRRVPVADVLGLAGCGRHLRIKKSIILLQLNQLFKKLRINQHTFTLSLHNLTIMPVFSTL